MLLKGPTPGGGVSVGGIEFKCDDRGVLDVADANATMISVLKETHGFVEYKPEPVAEPVPKQPEPKKTLVVTDDPPPPPAADPKALLTDEDIEAMDRKDMFAFLEARGIAVAGNISNVNLREAVRENRAAPEKAPEPKTE